MRTTAHALESFSSLHAPNPNQNATKLVTTIGLRPSIPATALLLVVQSPALGQLLLMLDSASFHVEACRRHLLHHLTTKLQFCVVFIIFPSCRCTSFCLGPLDLSSRSPGLPSSTARGLLLACALLCAVQDCMSACRTRLAANPRDPQGGAQTGRSPGGAGGKLSLTSSETK